MATFFNNAGASFTAKHSFTSKAQASFGACQRFMRVGNIGVAVNGSLNEIWAAEEFEDVLTYTREEFSVPAHFESYRRDRLTQLRNIELSVRASHPLCDKILAAIAAERALF